jgi:septation ring formation regulator EzrA
MLRFFKNFGKAKASSAAEKAAELLARIDPDTVTEAAILEVEDQLKIVTEECAKARIDANREQKEADAINELQAKRMVAAEKLQAQLEADPNNTELQEALNELLETMEEVAPDIQRENDEAKEAKEILEVLEENCSAMAQQLRDLRKNADRMKKDILRAEQEKERAERREEQAKLVSGIKKSTSGFSVAMKAMEKAAENTRVEADAASIRAKLLAEPVKKSNALIEEAMGNTKAPISNSSLAERMAKLKANK